ncbi:MAG: WS/DGAT/MGAT family O-acyltransferase, partial [Nevskiales bacterium]
SPIDSTFLYMESTRTPMHVGSLLTFKMPKDAPADYFQQLIEVMRSQPFMPAPFDCKLANTRLSKYLPAWEKTELDMEFHVRHSALPKPGGERELGSLVQRLHSNPMDLDRPLWEAHLIEGLKGRRFAFYFKAHHCAIDGMGAMNMTKKWLKQTPDDMSPPGVVDIQKRESGADRKLSGLLRKAIAKAAVSAKGLGELGMAMPELGKGDNSIVKASMNTPRSLFNVPVSQQRRLGTQLVKLQRLKTLARELNVTVNDITLSVVGGATRRYLLEQGALPDDPLTASVPIGLERSEDSGGNAVAGFVTTLATNVSDPLERVRRIHAATKRAKADLLAMSKPALENMALSGLLPLMIGQMTGTLAKMPPMFNFVVSNVVLTKHKLYLMGAEMEAMYPVSFLFDGYALNVTVIGYGENVAIGFLGCRDAIPKLQSLAVYAGDAVTELEQALKASKKKPSTPARKKGGRKSVTKRPASKTTKA